MLAHKMRIVSFTVKSGKPQFGSQLHEAMVLVGSLDHLLSMSMSRGLNYPIRFVRQESSVVA